MVLYNSLQDALKSMKLSKATYYRRVKDGELIQEKVKQGNNTLYKILTKLEAKPLELVRSDKDHLDDWIHWREQGIFLRPWSESYKKLQVGYIKMYFNRWSNISSGHLETWLKETLTGTHF